MCCCCCCACVCCCGYVLICDLVVLVDVPSSAGCNLPLLLCSCCHGCSCSTHLRQAVACSCSLLLESFDSMVASLQVHTRTHLQHPRLMVLPAGAEHRSEQHQPAGHQPHPQPNHPVSDQLSAGPHCSSSCCFHAANDASCRCCPAMPWPPLLSSCRACAAAL